MWIFECTKTYVEMRKKVSQAVFYISLIEVFVLAQISDNFAEMLKFISFGTETTILDIKIYIAYIYVPIIFSVLENAFRIHSKIGCLLKIEKTYAKKIIFKGYIDALNIDVSKVTKKELYQIYKSDRNVPKAIDNHFYFFVSGTNPRIDEHYVHMALSAWSWVWILLDSIFITILFGLVTIVYQINWKFILGIGVYIILQSTILTILLVSECKTQTQKEIIQAVKKDENEYGEEHNKILKDVIKNALSNK